MKYILLLISLIFLISCNDEKLPDNIYDKRKATSEQEIAKKDKVVAPGQVVSLQLEYINQDLQFCFGWNYDTGTSGVDEVKINIPEDYEFNYRLELNGHLASVKFLNESGELVFELNESNMQFKGLLTAGNYRIQIINPIEWVSPDSSLVPAFIQPDNMYLNTFANEILTKNYLKRDVYQLISIGKCEYCDLKSAESGIMDYQYLSNVSFRGSDLRNSDFSHSILNNTKFSSFIENNTKDFLWGHTNLNSAKFRYCNLDSSDLSNTYDMNNVDFYFSRLYRVNLNNSYGRYVNFESCILASSTFKNAEFKNSFFIGTVADSSLADSSKFIDTDLTYGIFNSSSFNYVKFTGSRLDYIRFDSVYAYGADFCLTSRVSANFDSLRVDDKTLCSPSSTESSSEIK